MLLNYSKDKKMKVFIATLVFFLLAINLNGQNKENTKYYYDAEVSHFFIGTNYISDAVFMGRKDADPAPYLFTTVGYQDKSGFYGNGSFSYLLKSDEQTIDLYLLTAGYNYYENNLYGDISFTAYFFNDDSYNVISKVVSDISAQFQYEFSFANLGLAASVYFIEDSGSDLIFAPEISKDFVSDNSDFQFSPSLSVNFGSQNFYQEYYSYSYIRKQKQGSGSGSGNGSGSGATGGTTETITEVVIEESDKFGIMAYELSLPMWYSFDSFTISLNPMLIFPVNESNIVIDDTIKKESLDTSFVMMLGLKYKF